MENKERIILTKWKLGKDGSSGNGGMERRLEDVEVK
jgi:hypothetical protein